MTYIESEKKEQGCVFCNAQNLSVSPENLIVFQGERAIAILNRFPYTSGHLMVLPYVHEAVLETLDVETRTEMMELATQPLQVLQMLYRPEGFNMSLNIGKAAGAGIAEHIHIHGVSRWVGDTNFVTAVGETRVFPEALE